MGKFVFRLDKVLEYREKIEDINKTEYGKAKRNLDDEIVLFEEILSHKESIGCERDKMASSATINDLKNYNLYLKNVKEKLINQKEIVEKAQNKVELARNKLINSSIDKKTLENLKNRDFDNHLYDMKKKEEKIIDQVVSYQSSMK
ncbi:flagellar export protein FliJ [Proteiniborus sp. MB09-C3]|uniref:flagellar export protein FliJ n=1 Tax=Proteiniborus sp. MB09-C3 TaxID=3050072 RepID=UPI002553590A|nr:flagellar export protein FliJ [Proteiniborus sp. MB09-C3]WIV10859.1 flagellar export protein FliJ [Proteiniborus sp. MB09-C3]